MREKNRALDKKEQKTWLGEMILPLPLLLPQLNHHLLGFLNS
jgi:hypothetical protein